MATATASNKQQSTKQRPPLRLPGFPQRVLPPTENNDEVKVAAASELPPSSTEEPSEELLKFEDDLRPQMVSEAATETPTTDDYESKMRYEFSETRKVLDEFFHKEQAVENDIRWVFKNSVNIFGRESFLKSHLEYPDVISRIILKYVLLTV